jgi:activator of HSP90 ATPase
MKTVAIRQRVTIRNATPRQVYDTLMDSRRHALLTGSAARIGRNVGDRFTAGDGWISGRNVELEPGRRIVQDWRGDEPGWPANHFSCLRIFLRPTAGGTLLVMYHSLVPARYLAMIRDGWWRYYWDPLQKLFAWAGRTGLRRGWGATTPGRRRGLV